MGSWSFFLNHGVGMQVLINQQLLIESCHKQLRCRKLAKFRVNFALQERNEGNENSGNILSLPVKSIEHQIS